MNAYEYKSTRNWILLRHYIFGGNLGGTYHLGKPIEIRQWSGANRSGSDNLIDVTSMRRQSVSVTAVCVNRKATL